MDEVLSDMLCNNVSVCLITISRRLDKCLYARIEFPKRYVTKRCVCTVNLKKLLAFTDSTKGKRIKVH